MFLDKQYIYKSARFSVWSIVSILFIVTFVLKPINEYYSCNFQIIKGTYHILIIISRPVSKTGPPTKVGVSLNLKDFPYAK